MRKKVKLAFIENDSVRKTTFRKRKRGLLKKITELTTLCDILACAIIYSPYDSQPEVWPWADGVQQVISQFNIMPGMVQTRKMVSQESFLRQRISKAIEQLRKQIRENWEKEITQVMFHTLTGQSLSYQNILDLTDLGWIIDQNLKKIITRIETLTVNHSYAGAVVETSVAEGTVVVAEQQETVGFDVNGGSVQRPDMFIDLINPPNQFQFGGGAVAGGGDEMLVPFSDLNQNNLWSNDFSFI